MKADLFLGTVQLQLKTSANTNYKDEQYLKNDMLYRLRDLDATYYTFWYF